MGPGVRLRRDPGRDASLARPVLARLRPGDARAGTRVVGLVGLRVGGERRAGGVARAARRLAAGDGPDLHRRPLAASRVRRPGDAVRLQLRRRPFSAPGSLRARVEARPCFVVGDRRVRAHGRDRHDAPLCRLVPRPDGTRRALDAGGGDRLRRPGLAHSRAPSRPAAGGGRSFRRALQPVRDHLPGRIDRRDRPERERATDGRRPGCGRHSGPVATIGLWWTYSTASPARRRPGSAITTTPCWRRPTATATSIS